MGLKKIGLLTSGGSLSCGCYNREISRSMGRDLMGQTFGRLTVIARSGSNKHNGGRLWECKCSCGNTTITRADALLSGHTQSCGTCCPRETMADRTRIGSEKEEQKVFDHSQEYFSARHVTRPQVPFVFGPNWDLFLWLFESPQ